MHLTRNQAYGNIPYRGFESLSFRQNKDLKPAQQALRSGEPARWSGW